MVVSLAGGRLSSIFRMTHLRAQLLMSGVGGLMLGIAMLHLLPHATETLGSASKAGFGCLAGLTAMFLLVRLFHTHDHGVPQIETAAIDGDVNETGEANSDLDHAHECSHHHHESPKGRFSWIGLFAGLLLHTIVDGIALAASVAAEAEHGAWLGLAGLGTFLAVALHKPLDAFAITSVMQKQHWSSVAQWIANFSFSLSCPAGALAFYFGVSESLGSSALLGWGLAVSAGFFVSIASADLLPEVAFHDHDRVKLTATFLLGIGIAIGVEQLPGHSHSHDEPDSPKTSEIEDEGAHSHPHGHNHDH